MMYPAYLDLIMRRKMLRHLDFNCTARQRFCLRILMAKWCPSSDVYCMTRRYFFIVNFFKFRENFGKRGCYPLQKKIQSPFYTDSSVFSAFHSVQVYNFNSFEFQEQQPKDEEIIQLAQKSVEDPHWMIIMLSGGHFAAAIFKGAEPILHKTFHCYTVRAKQGGSQSTKDGKGNYPKSAGASLRRYNETALVQHVQELLSAWSSDIEKCSLILYRAVGPTNRQVLFGGKEPPLNKSDVRLRSIPFPTRRPTFTQLKYVHAMLCSVHVYNSVDVLTTVIESKHRRDPVQSKKSHIDRSKSRPSPDRQLPNHIQELVDIQTPSGSESEIIQLIQEVQEVSFHEDLKEMDNSFENENRVKRKNRRKKKKQSDEPKHLMFLSKKLLNAVDCPDDDKLESILMEIKETCTEEEFANLLNKSYDTSKNTLLHLAAKNGHKNNIR